MALNRLDQAFCFVGDGLTQGSNQEDESIVDDCEEDMVEQRKLFSMNMT